MDSCSLERWITVKEVAAMLAIHPNRVYALPLQVYRLGRRRRYRYAEVVSYMEGLVEV